MTTAVGRCLLFPAPDAYAFKLVASICLLVFDEKSCTVATVVLACAGGYRANMLIFAA